MVGEMTFSVWYLDLSPSIVCVHYFLYTTVCLVEIQGFFVVFTHEVLEEI